MANHVISHKIICENQCTMTKLNYEILLKINHETYPLKQLHR
jgi:hypothetical protein